MPKIEGRFLSPFPSSSADITYPASPFKTALLANERSQKHMYGLLVALTSVGGIGGPPHRRHTFHYFRFMKKFRYNINICQARCELPFFVPQPFP